MWGGDCYLLVREGSIYNIGKVHSDDLQQLELNFCGKGVTERKAFFSL